MKNRKEKNSIIFSTEVMRIVLKSSLVFQIKAKKLKKLLPFGACFQVIFYGCFLICAESFGHLENFCALTAALSKILHR